MEDLSEKIQLFLILIRGTWTSQLGRTFKWTKKFKNPANFNKLHVVFQCQSEKIYFRFSLIFKEFKSTCYFTISTFFMCI